MPEILPRPPIEMPPDDYLNACLLAVRTVEVKLENSISHLSKLDRDVAETKGDIGDVIRDIAILRNDLDGFVKIRNYLITACLAQLVALFFTIPALIIQVQQLNSQSNIINKIAK